MLHGICAEAVELLKDKQISPGAIQLIRKVKPIRQIEMAELMNGVRNYSKMYAQALIVATRKDQFIDAGKTKERIGIKPESMIQMEKEMETLEKDFKLIEESYGKNVLNLVLARGYIEKLLNNGKVVRFLSANHNDILDEFQKIVDTVSLEG